MSYTLHTKIKGGFLHSFGYPVCRLDPRLRVDDGTLVWLQNRQVTLDTSSILNAALFAQQFVD